MATNAQIAQIEAEYKKSYEEALSREVIRINQLTEKKILATKEEIKAVKDEIKAVKDELEAAKEEFEATKEERKKRYDDEYQLKLESLRVQILEKIRSEKQQKALKEQQQAAEFHRMEAERQAAHEEKVRKNEEKLRDIENERIKLLSEREDLIRLTKSFPISYTSKGQAIVERYSQEKIDSLREHEPHVHSQPYASVGTNSGLPNRSCEFMAVHGPGYGYANHPNSQFLPVYAGRENTPRVYETVSLKDVQKSLPRFNGTDRAKPVSHWISAMEQINQVYGWSQLHLLVAAKSCLEGAALTWSRMCYNVTSWEDFKNKLEEEFRQETSTGDVMLELIERKRKRDETPSMYIQVIRSIASQVDIGDADVIRFISTGLTTDQNTMFNLRSAKNIADLKQKVRLLEETDVLKISEEVHTKDKQNDNKQSQDEKVSDTDKRCYNCKNFGHFSQECQEPSELEMFIKKHDPGDDSEDEVQQD